MEITDRAIARMADSPLHPMLRTALRKASPLAALVAAVVVPSAASALSLGEPDLRSFRGQPLEVRIPLTLARGDYIGLECFKVRAGPGSGAPLVPLAATRFRLDETIDSATLLIRSHETFDQSVLLLDISARCPGAAAESTRQYRLELPSLTGPDTPAADAAPAMVIIQRPGEAPIIQPLAPSTASPSSTAARGTRTWRVSRGDTLDSIARGIYPRSAKLRAAFIARLREAQPEALPGDRDPLPVGRVLVWPDLVALANASPRLDAAASKSAPAPQPQAAPPQAPRSPSAAPAVASVTVPAPGAAPGRPDSAKPAAGTAPARPAPAPAAPKAKPEAGFALRLSGAQLDVSRSQGVSESTRAALREKQLLLDADDQVAALLSLRNTVKQLEGRLNDMQLRLATVPPVAGKAAPESPARSATPSASPAAPSAAPAAAPSAATPATPAPATPASTTPPDPATAASDSKPAQPAPDKVATESRPAGKVLARPPAPRGPEPAAEEESPWWMSPYLALGLAVLLLLVGLGVWARRKPKPAQTVDHFDPDGPNPLSGDLLPSTPHTVASAPDSVADQFEDDLEARFAVTAAAQSGSRKPDPLPAIASRNSGFRPQETMRMQAQPAAEPDDAFFAASLELDTRPATSIDFVLGDENSEDKSRRQRYMEERFPELASHAIAVDDPDSIIDVARHHYEESELERAVELLTYALEERPGQLRFWLALFEIYRLEQKAEEFFELATRFKNVHGGTDAWPKVQHIGRDLDPSQALYAAALGRLGVPVESDFDPVSENWLNVPMDFTSEVLMIELRQCLLADHDVDVERLSRPLLESA